MSAALAPADRERLARLLDAAPPDDNGAPGAYEDLCKFLADRLDPDDMGQAEAMLTQLFGKTDVTQDEDGPLENEPAGGVYGVDPTFVPPHAKWQLGRVKGAAAQARSTGLLVG